MTFLYPTFLYFLPLAALPFIIHLTGERKYRPYDFSSLKFLREIERDSLKKLRWRQWLILLLRTLAILLFVLALAKPLYRGLSAGPDSGILLIDRSFSTRIDPAYPDKIAAVEQAFGNWHLMTFNEHSDPDSLRAGIRDHMETRKLHEPCLLMAGDFQNNRQNRNIVEILADLPLHPVFLPLPKAENNFAVRELNLLPEYSGDGLLSMELRSGGNPQSLQIRINGRAAGRVDTGENGSGIFRFDPGDAEYVRCSAHCEDDAYPEDNVRYLVAQPGNRFRILDIAGIYPSGYHQQAIRAMRGADLKTLDPQFLPAEDLWNYDMLILDAFTDLPLAQLQRIEKFSEEKPLLLIAGAADADPAFSPLSGDSLRLLDLGGDFAVFHNPYDAAELFRIHRYYRSRRSAAETIWRLGNGDPLLVRQDARRYILYSPFIFDWNEMGLSPYFTRLLAAFIRRALQTERADYQTGDALQLNRPEFTVKTPGGEVHQMRGPFTETDVPGFYLLQAPGINREVAVNIPADECVQEMLQPQYPDTLLRAGTDPEALARELRGRDLQSAFFIMAAACLLAEMLLAGKGEQSVSWKK